MLSPSVGAGKLLQNRPTSRPAGPSFSGQNGPPASRPAQEAGSLLTWHRGWIGTPGLVPGPPPEPYRGEGSGCWRQLLSLPPPGMLIQRTTWGSMLVPASVSSSIKWGHSSLWGFAVRIHEEVCCAGGCGCRPCSCFASALIWGLGGSSPSLCSCPSGRAAGAGLRGGGGGALAHRDLGCEHAAPLELEDTGWSPPQRFGSPWFRPSLGIPACPPSRSGAGQTLLRSLLCPLWPV